MPFANPFVFVLGVFVVLLMARAVVIIPENKRGAVVRLGMYRKTLKPGLHIRVPFIDLVTKVDLDANIPGWQGLSDRDLEAAVESLVMIGTAVPVRPSVNRATSASEASSKAPEAFAAWLVKAASDQIGVDLSNDQMAKQRIADRAASAVEELRSSPSCEINLPFITADATGPKHFSTTLTRAQVEKILGSSIA